MGERTDDVGDYDRLPYDAGGSIPPDEELDEALRTGRPDLGDTDTDATDTVDVTDRDAALAGAPEDETVDVTDRYERLATRAGVERSDTPDTPDTPDSATGAMRGADDTSDMGAPSDDPDQIRGDIEETRVEMSQTIDEIQERLSPRRLAQQATDTVREATIGRAEQMMSDARDTAQNAGQSLWMTIRENPIPTALVGLGVGWLLYKAWDNMPSSGSRSGDYGDYGAGNGYGGYPRYGDRYTTGYDGMMYRSRGYDATGEEEDGEDGGPSMTDRVQQKAGEMTDRVQQKAGEMSDQISDTAQQWTDQAQYQAQRAQNWLRRSWDQNPLVMGALSLAAGAVLGLSIPESEPENQLMGSARDSLMDKAQDTAQKAQVVAKRAASAATDAAKGAAQDEAQKQGLTQKS